MTWAMACFIAVVLFTLGMTSAPAAETNLPVKKVLILYSMGRGFASFNVMSDTFRTELARQSPVPIDYHELSIETVRFSEGVDEEHLVNYLHTVFLGREPDLIATMGGPATLFVNRHRAEMFPEVPLLAGTTSDYWQILLAHRQRFIILNVARANVIPTRLK